MNKPLTSAQLMSGPAIPEWILLVGRYATGKSSAIVSVAQWIELTQPDAKFYVIDTEKKFRSALQGFKADAPNNIVYYRCDSMDECLLALVDILTSIKPGDWIAIESNRRV